MVLKKSLLLPWHCISFLCCSAQCKEQFQVQESYKRVVSMGEGKVIRELLCAFYMHLGHD